MYRLIFFTLPATVLILWLAAGKYNENQQRDHTLACRQVARGLALAALLYSEEHGDRLPPADHWEEALRPYLGGAPVTVPPLTGGHGRRYAMNRAVAGRRLKDLDMQAFSVILFFESTSNAPDTADEFATLIPREDPSQLVLAYVDGHVEDYYPAIARDAVIQRSRDALKTSPPAHR
jgi:hypothetical protein